MPEVELNSTKSKMNTFKFEISYEPVEPISVMWCRNYICVISSEWAAVVTERWCTGATSFTSDGAWAAPGSSNMVTTNPMRLPDCCNLVYPQSVSFSFHNLPRWAFRKATWNVSLKSLCHVVFFHSFHSCCHLLLAKWNILKLSFLFSSMFSVMLELKFL